MRTFAFFGAKNIGSSKFMMCPHGQRGERVEQVRTRKRGQFLRFCADVFLDGSLYVFLSLLKSLIY